jgi:hypothetical protein
MREAEHEEGLAVRLEEGMASVLGGESPGFDGAELGHRGADGTENGSRMKTAE